MRDILNKKSDYLSFRDGNALYLRDGRIPGDILLCLKRQMALCLKWNKPIESNDFIALGIDFNTFKERTVEYWEYRRQVWERIHAQPGDDMKQKDQMILDDAPQFLPLLKIDDPKEYVRLRQLYLKQFNEDADNLKNVHNYDQDRTVRVILANYEMQILRGLIPLEELTSDYQEKFTCVLLHLYLKLIQKLPEQTVQKLVSGRLSRRPNEFEDYYREELNHVITGKEDSLKNFRQAFPEIFGKQDIILESFKTFISEKEAKYRATLTDDRQKNNALTLSFEAEKNVAFAQASRELSQSFEKTPELVVSQAVEAEQPPAQPIETQEETKAEPDPLLDHFKKMEGFTTLQDYMTYLRSISRRKGEQQQLIGILKKEPHFINIIRAYLIENTHIIYNPNLRERTDRFLHNNDLCLIDTKGFQEEWKRDQNRQEELLKLQTEIVKFRPRCEPDSYRVNNLKRAIESPQNSIDANQPHLTKAEEKYSQDPSEANKRALDSIRSDFEFLRRQVAEGEKQLANYYKDIEKFKSALSLLEAKKSELERGLSLSEFTLRIQCQLDGYTIPELA